MKTWNKNYFALVTLIVVILLFTPFAVSQELRLGVIKMKDFWFYGINIFLFLVVLVNGIINSRIHFSVNWVDILVLAYHIFITIRIILDNSDYFLLNNYFTECFLVFLYFVLRQFYQTFSGKYYRFFLIILSLGLMVSALGQAGYGLLQSFNILNSQNTNFAITGSFGNPAPYAIFLAAVFPFSLALYLKTRKNKWDNLYGFGQEKWKWSNLRRQLQDINILNFFLAKTALITLITIVLVLPSTHIRTGWLMAVIGGAFVLTIHYRPKIKRYWRRFKILILCLIIPLSIGLGTGFYLFKEDSANGRMLIYQVAIDKFLENPLWGQGYNSFYSQYNNWQGEWFRNHPEQLNGDKAYLAGNVVFAYNEFLEVSVEYGLFGLILFTLPLLVIFNSFIKQFKGDHLEGEEFHFVYSEINSWNSIILSFTVLLLAVIMGCITSYPLVTLIGKLLYVLSLAVLSSTLPLKKIRVFKLRSQVLKLLYVMGIVTLYYLSSAQIDNFKTFKRWNKAYTLMIFKDYNNALKIYSELMPELNTEQRFLQEYAKVLSLNGEHFKSNSILEESYPYGRDIFWYITLGDNYKNLKDYKKAEKAYKNAHYLQPAMLFPEYLLVKLYKSTGQFKKAYLLALKVSKKKVKIISPASTKIKEEIQEILENKSYNLEN